MPTARELLEQADALMRRNRAPVDDDIPVLTDAVAAAEEAQSRFAPELAPAPAAPAGLDEQDDVPLLTDEVEEIEAAPLGSEVDEGEPSVWLDFEESEPSVIGGAPDSIAIVPPVQLHPAAPEASPGELQPHETAPAIIAGGAAALLHSGMPPAVSSPAEATEPPASPKGVPDAAHWEAIAEEIRMQVLQRIDLFTDTGLRTQLGARLQPIVDRASADLVATINQHVGELLRAYVAEAIEREIESWRKEH
jgi:hypothetical protein